MNDDSIEGIVETSFVEATRKARPACLPPECNPENVLKVLDEAYSFYKAHNCLPATNPFVSLCIKYVFPLLNGIKELIVSPHSEKETMALLDKGFTFDQVVSAKNSFVQFAGSKRINPAVLADEILGSLDDWLTEDYSPDPRCIDLLGQFFRYLASGRSQLYY